MKKIAITGNIASGKSYAHKIINDCGYPIIDCDDIVKNLYEDKNVISKIKEIFPQIVVKNQIDKAKLSDLIFKNIETRLKFENLIYPLVIEKFHLFFETNQAEDKVFVIVPLLFEANMQKYFDKVVLIVADENIRKKRLLARNSFLSNYADMVINSQMLQEDKIKLCDYIIENNGTLEEFKSAIEKFLTEG